MKKQPLSREERRARLKKAQMKSKIKMTPGGLSYMRNIFDFSNYNDIEVFKPDENGTKIEKSIGESYICRVSFLPFNMTNKHPFVVSGDNKEGDECLLLPYGYHYLDGNPLLCLWSTYGKECPICKYKNEAYKSGDEKTYNFLKNSDRVIYNLCCNDKFFVFPTSNYSFHSKLYDALTMEYDDPESDVCILDVYATGNDVKFMATKKGSMGLDISNIQFTKRTKDIPNEILSKSISFDSLLIVPTYDELENAFLSRKLKQSSQIYNKEAEQKENNIFECPYKHNFGEADKHGDDCLQCGDDNESQYYACVEKGTELEKSNNME